MKEQLLREPEQGDRKQRGDSEAWRVRLGAEDEAVKGTWPWPEQRPYF